MKFNYLALLGCLLLSNLMGEEHNSEFDVKIKPFLKKYCVECHGGKKTKGEINFKAIDTIGQAFKKYEVWDKAIDVMHEGDMPPEDELQPSEAEMAMFESWHKKTFVDVQARAGVARLQRLSVFEYRESLRSLLGFDLEISFIKTGATTTERSLVLKMMPPDPPGESGFSNDTVKSPITETIWEKYNFITNTAVENLFSKENQSHLEVYTGPIKKEITRAQGIQLVSKFMMKAFKTKDCKEAIDHAVQKLEKSLNEKASLVTSLKNSLKTILLSPQFIYKSYQVEGPSGEYALNGYDLAQKLSYFLWGTVPDQQLLTLAEKGSLTKPEVLLKECDRLLDDPRSKFFTSTFAREWLSIDEIKKSTGKNDKVQALYEQPIKFVDYLIREDRPIIEAIDSKVTYVNDLLKNYYDKEDSKTIPRFSRPKGLEVVVRPLHRIEMKHTDYRGGVLTMPGLLSMYSGHKRTSPILRGIWVLERILGDELAEPPMDVPPIPVPKKGEELTFREIFEKHQSNPNCAVCHSRIDPLGFGLENFGPDGAFRQSGKGIDSSGKTPDGDEFKDFIELKDILVEKYRSQIIHTMTEKMFSYALARNLEVHDKPVINKIAKEFDANNGGYRTLIKEVVTSLPFTHAFIQ